MPRSRTFTQKSKEKKKAKMIEKKESTSVKMMEETKTIEPHHSRDEAFMDPQYRHVSCLISTQ